MLIKDLYNIDSFKSFEKKAKTHFADASAGVVLSRNLTGVDPKLFQKLYPELSFLNSGIFIDNSGGAVQRIQSLRIITEGNFTNSGDVSGNKGKISQTAEDSFLKVIEREAFSDWSDTQVQQAALQNIPLVSNLFQGHDRKFKENIDEIGFTGIPEYASSTGLLNYGGFTSSAAAGAIIALTDQEKYDVISNLIIAQRNAVNNTPGYAANNVIMPIRVMNVLQSTILNSANGSFSVLKALQSNYPEVTFSTTFRAESVGGTSVTVAYSSNENVMKMRIPQRLTIGEVTKPTSFDYRFDSKFRIAGLDILEDLAGRLLTGL